MSPSNRPTNKRPRAPKKRGNAVVFAVAGVVIAVAAAMAVAFSGSDDASTSRALPPVQVTVTGDPLPMLEGEPDAAVGEVAPEVAGFDFEGEAVRIAADGTPKMVLFLAHWCPHCQREVPKVQKWLDANGMPVGVKLVSVSTSVTAERPNYPPQRWLKREGWTVPVIRDDESQVSLGYGLSGFPFFVFLDGQNRVVERGSGELSIKEIEAALDRARRAAITTTSSQP